MAKCRALPEWSQWVESLSLVLHADNRWRLLVLMTGMLFARGRLTVSSWLRGARITKDFQDYYYFVSAVGKRVDAVAGRLLTLLFRHIEPGPVVLFALDDTPTKRYGPKVEGAGLHHNPTPGPSQHEWVYGHVWVVLSWVVRHRLWSTIALPLLARLYVRQCDVANPQKLPPQRRWKFRTKLELAADLIEWLAERVKSCGKTLRIVADGFYAKRPLLKRAAAAGVVVFSRLRCDAALFEPPPEIKPNAKRGRGRPRKYGAKRLSLATRAGHPRGWTTGEFTLYGKLVTKTYKTFLASYRPAGGLIRVVLVKDDDRNWRAFFSTDPHSTVTEILEAVADRAAIEQNFHDLKEVEGLGQPQLRNIWANVGACHLNLWLHTLTELWSWHQPHSILTDRRDSPWDDAARRPSHADRRNALRRSSLEHQFQKATTAQAGHSIIRTLFKTLCSLVA